jgi:hypothetical protein
MKRLRRCTKPAQTDPYVEIVRISKARPLFFVCLSNALWGVWVHWNGRASEPCTGETKIECEGHRRGLPLRQKFYVHAIREDGGKEVFVELTPGAATELLSFFQEGEPLRGYRLECWRSSDTKGARYHCRAFPAKVPAASLPPELDPEPYLWRLWGVARGPMDTEPIGPRGAAALPDTPLERVRKQQPDSAPHANGRVKEFLNGIGKLPID